MLDFYFILFFLKSHLEKERERVFPSGALSPGGDLIGWFAFFSAIMLFLEWLAAQGNDRSSLSSLVKCLENIQGGEFRDCVGDHYYCTEPYHWEN